jgi:hypothetical protein
VNVVLATVSTVAVKNAPYVPRHRVNLDSPQQATLVKSIEGCQHGTGVSLITTSIIGRWWIKEFYRVAFGNQNLSLARQAAAGIRCLGSRV